MIGAVVRKSGTRNAYDPRAPWRRGACVEHGFFIPRPGSNHHVLMASLAQKVTSGRQMASNPSAPFGIEFGDIDDLQVVAPGSRSGVNGGANGVARLPTPANAGLAAGHGPSLAPFAALAA